MKINNWRCRWHACVFLNIRNGQFIDFSIVFNWILVDEFDAMSDEKKNNNNVKYCVKLRYAIWRLG